MSKKKPMPASELYELAQRDFTAGLLKMAVRNFAGGQIAIRCTPSSGDATFEVWGEIDPSRVELNSREVTIYFRRAIGRTDGEWIPSGFKGWAFTSPGECVPFQNTVHGSRFCFFQRFIKNGQDGLMVALMLPGDPDLKEMEK